MITNLLFLLLPLAAASGWYFARRHYKARNNVSALTRGYLVGLNYLLNEQPDKAVDIFIKMLEVDSETVETHLALGVLFRRRGEIDRAIRIHQNLIARPQLPAQHRIEALVALGEDYFRAGMFDRAERLLLEVTTTPNPNISIAAHHLIDIYQRQKRWQEAIEIGRKLLGNNEEIQATIAHYFCELAMQAYEQKQYQQVQQYLKKALSADPNCVRASLLQGKLEIQLHNYKLALSAYKHVSKQNPDYLPETIGPIATCYQHLDDESGLINYLQTSLQKYPRTSILLVLTERLKQRDGTHAAIEFIAAHLNHYPSLRGLQQLISLQLEIAEDKTREKLLALNNLTVGLLKNKPIYRCVNCGFNSKTLHWLCPSCRRWASVKPIQGLEGE